MYRGTEEKKIRDYAVDQSDFNKLKKKSTV